MRPPSTPHVIDEETARLVNMAREEHARERVNRTPMNDVDDVRILGVATVGGGVVAVLPNQVTPELIRQVSDDASYPSLPNLSFDDEDEDFLLEPGVFDVWVSLTGLNAPPVINVQVIAPVQVIAQVTDNDVLLGRGGLTNQHPGNILWRALAAQLRPEYITTNSNKTKRQISLRLIDMVKANGGRFLKKNANGEYIEVADADVINKSSAAIREDPALAKERRIKMKAAKRHSLSKRN